MIYRISWIEYRPHSIEIEAENEEEAIELAQEMDYEQTASETSWHGETSARVVDVILA